MRQEQCRQQIAYAPRPPVDDGGIGAVAFHAAIVREILAVAVGAIFAIRLVVFDAVAGDVGQREPVVSGDEIDRTEGLAPRSVEN